MEKPSLWLSVTGVVTLALSLSAGSCGSVDGETRGGSDSGASDSGATDSGGNDSGGNDSGGTDSGASDSGLGGQDAMPDADASPGLGEAGVGEAGTDADAGPMADAAGVCTPGQTLCSGNEMQTCGPSGTWGALVPCDHQTCVNASGGADGGGSADTSADSGSSSVPGSCQGVCAPGDLGCGGQQPQTCGSTGQWQDAGAACSASQTCVSGACAGACGPGQTTCVGNTPQSCGASGEWQAGTACSGTTPYCDQGSCVQCVSDGECPGNVDDCGHPSCSSDACTMAYTTANTPTTSNPPQVAGNCHQIVCDGAGGHSSVVDDANVPSSGTVCITDQCNSGVVVPTSNPGVTCGTSAGIPEMCDSAGLCGCHSIADCTAPSTCGGGGVPLVCGCTPTTCTVLGQTCGGPFSDACYSSLVCNDNVEDGTETDVDCGGVAAAGSTCSVACATSKKCKVGSDCKTGFCADGVCCNAACTGTCEACSAAAKGQGADGACGAVILGQDPHANCSNMGAASCGESGGCNGSGACSTYPAGTQCKASTCSGTVLTKPDTCAAAGICTAPTPATQECAPFLCSGGACTTSCTGDGQCTGSAYCFLGAGVNHDKCVPKLGTGTGTCTAADECASGACGTNGVCCVTTCTVTNPPCGLTGACAAGSGVCQNAGAGTTCSAAVSCSSGMLTTDTQCDGNGSCASAVMIAACPGNAICSGATACDNGCGTSDADCLPGNYCSAGACVAQGGAGASCGAVNQCTSGICNGPAGSSHCCLPGGCVTGGLCGATGCDGSGACVYPNGACSGAPSCVGTQLSTPSACSNGSCNGTPTACPGSLTCIATASPNACGCGTNDPTGDALCPATQWCDGTSNGNAGACQAQQPNGQPCNRDAQCTSGCNLASGTCN